MTQAKAPPAFLALLDSYERYLVAEKNLSPYTLRNYRTDLFDFARYFDEHEDVGPLEADRQSFRSYLSAARDSGACSRGFRSTGAHRVERPGS